MVVCIWAKLNLETKSPSALALGLFFECGFVARLIAEYDGYENKLPQFEYKSIHNYDEITTKFHKKYSTLVRMRSLCIICNMMLRWQQNATVITDLSVKIHRWLLVCDAIRFACQLQINEMCALFGGQRDRQPNNWVLEAVNAVFIAVMALWFETRF